MSRSTARPSGTRKGSAAPDPRRDPARVASIVAVLGVTGCGKTTHVRERLDLERELDPRPVMVWDFKREWVGELATSARGLVELVSAPAFKRRDQVVVYRPSFYADVRALEFDLFCELALEVAPVTVVVEELKFVTLPNKAPARWAMLVMTGRDLGVHVIGTSQRPASIDKDFLGNATVIHCGRLVYDDDIDTVAKAARVTRDELAELHDLEFIESDRRTGEIRRGVVAP